MVFRNEIKRDFCHRVPEARVTISTRIDNNMHKYLKKLLRVFEQKSNALGRSCSR